MKKTELIFNFISIPTDAVSLGFAGIVSFYLREKSINYVGPIIYRLDVHEFLLVVYKIIPALILIFAILGLYNLKGTRKFANELGKIVVGISLGLLLVILLFFFNQSIFPSRFIILATWGLGIIFVTVGRLILKQFQILLFDRDLGLHKLVIIKGSSQTVAIIEKIFKNPKHGYKATAELEYSQEIFSQLEKLYSQNLVDEILQANTNLSEEMNLKLVQFARNKGLKFSFVPNLFEVQRNIVETDNLNGIPLISLKNTPLDGWGKVSKRILDIAASLVCLILTAPIFLIICVAIKLDSKGKFIYSADRRGRGKNFKCYKFRSMYSHLSVGQKYGGEEAEQIRRQLWQKNDRGGANGPFLKIKDDPRVTKVGRFLRRSKLDEIPQFWNVLKGDMSMVGPRAHVLDEVQRYRDSYARMFSIKPGIFGVSQISQMSWPDLPFDEEIRLNTYYIENWSLWLDIKVLGESLFLLFFGKASRQNY